MPFLTNDPNFLHGFRPSFFGSISAILRMQSAAVSCGPDTNVPLTLIAYQPCSTPRRSASSALTCLGARFCIACFRLAVIVLKLTARLLSFPRKAGLNPPARIQRGRDDGYQPVRDWPHRFKT